MALEDSGDPRGAEAEFIAAGSPREAIDMYLHARSWKDALRVAQEMDSSAVADVLVAHVSASNVRGYVERRGCVASW